MSDLRIHPTWRTPWAGDPEIVMRFLETFSPPSRVEHPGGVAMWLQGYEDSPQVFQ
jgi:hypothetical protein